LNSRSPRKSLPGVEHIRDDAVGELGKPESERLVDGVAVDREVGGPTDALVMPRRCRVPLLGEIEPERAWRVDRLERQPRCVTMRRELVRKELIPWCFLATVDPFQADEEQRRRVDHRRKRPFDAEMAGKRAFSNRRRAEGP
jgi:hypothetical protein